MVDTILNHGLDVGIVISLIALIIFAWRER